MLVFILAVIAALSCFAAWQSEQKRKRCKAGTWHRAQLVDFSSHKEKRGSGMYRTTVTVSELTVILADDREGIRRTVTSERRSAKRYRGQTEIDIFRIPAEHGAGYYDLLLKEDIPRPWETAAALLVGGVCVGMIVMQVAVWLI
ncbi:MAG: hypothetical protein IJ595_07605 [Oscillospiraceae bacterium]|nr:hypothetical protein [Oscillospiraceae bacterium]